MLLGMMQLGDYGRTAAAAAAEEVGTYWLK